MNRFRVAFNPQDRFHVVDRFGNVLDANLDTRAEAQGYADDYNRMEREAQRRADGNEEARS